MSIGIFLVLLIVGILLICAEVFVPGGVLGTIGALCLAGAIVSTFFVESLRDIAVFISLAIVALLGVSIVLWIKYFPKSRIGQKMTLTANSAGFKASEEGLPALLGKEGVTKCDLHPAGFAIIEGRRVDVVTEGGMIANGNKVRVVEVEGNRVVVRKITA